MPEVTTQAIVDLLPTPLPTTQRFVIAIAGPPASGKSTLAAELSTAFQLGLGSGLELGLGFGADAGELSTAFR